MSEPSSSSSPKIRPESADETTEVAVHRAKRLDSALMKVIKAHHEATTHKKQIAGGLVIAAVLFALALATYVDRSSTTPESLGSADLERQDTEPCRVEAPEAYRVPAAELCRSAGFSAVNIRAEDGTVVTVLHLSRAGDRGWETDKQKYMAQFRDLTQDLIDKGGFGDVAVSVHGSDGRSLGGCARPRGTGATICQ